MKKKFLLLVAAFGMAVGASSLNFAHSASATTTGTNSFMVPSTSSSTTAASGLTSVSALSSNGEFAVVNAGFGNSILGIPGGSRLLNIDDHTSSKILVSTAGVDGSPDISVTGAALSETGRYVAFGSDDTNLIDGTTISGANTQLYLRDTHTGTTTLLSQDSSGNPANNSISTVYGVSADGRFVLFATNATNLVPSVSGFNIYMLDRSTGTFTVVNKDYDGTYPSGTPSYAQMSCDGSFVAFGYGGGAITKPSDASGTYIYLLDRRVGDKVVNLTSSFGAASGSAAISCNGEHIGFVNYYNNVDPNQPSSNYNAHGYVYDRIDDSYHMVDQSTSGDVGNSDIASNGTAPCSMWYGWGLTTSCLQISDNDIATFSSAATNLVTSAPAGVQAYVRNIKTGETDLITQTSGTQATYTPLGISADGKSIAYNSSDNDLVSGGTDTNNNNDAFLYQTGF